ncbi:ABC transporter permease [Dethiothermospora halolimnae]|uniref:ABC transporter permease n=1 Tax=Dethiothermospora halolimnae TaxID=3114390 RepID=UPI003CCC00DA
MINPVLKKDLKGKMRTWKTTILISIYVLLLSGIALTMFYFAYSEGGRDYYSSSYVQSFSMITTVLIVLQMQIIMLIVPATTSSSISGEKQRRTFDILLCTRLSSGSIVLGKLMTGISQVILLLVVSIPVYSVLTIYGLIGIGDILLIYGYFILISIFLGSMGIFLSSVFKKSITSTIVSYLITMFITGGIYVILFIISNIYYRFDETKGFDFMAKLLYVNPFTGLSGILSNSGGWSGFWRIFTLGKEPSASKVLFTNIATYIGLSILFLVLASIRINPMKKFGNKIRKK